jgi:hypothetical protein
MINKTNIQKKAMKRSEEERRTLIFLKAFF